MQTRAERGQFREGGHVLQTHVLGVRSHEAQAFQAGQGGHLGQQLSEAHAVAALVVPEGVDVLAKQGDFARALVQAGPAFVQNGRGGA